MASQGFKTSRILLQPIQQKFDVKGVAISDGGVTVESAFAFVLATAAVTALSFSVVLASERPPEGGVNSFGITPTSSVDEADGGSAAIVPSAEDWSLVETAHELRRKLPPPHQSLFRVVCILVYEDYSGGVRQITGE